MIDPLTSSSSGSRKPALFYGYIIVASAIVSQVIAWGMYNSYGVYFNSLLAEFGWPRATIAGALSLAQVTLGIGAMILGYLNDRFGPRVLMTACSVLTGLGFFLMSQVHQVWQLYLFYSLIMAVGMSGIDVILLSTTARWFVKRRAMMSGIVKIGTGLGMMIFPLLSVWLISANGWRNTYALMGIVLLVSVAAAAQLLRRDPYQMGQLPDGKRRQGNIDVKPVEEGLPLLQALRTRPFWMISLAYFVVFFCTMTIIVHISPYLVDLKLSPVLGATMVSIIGASSIGGRLLMGIAADKAGSRRALIICFVVVIAAFSWLLVAGTLWAFVVFAVVYGFSHGGFYALASPAVADYFGTRAHGGIFGITICIGSWGAAVGPVVTGYIFDLTDNYRLAFIMLLLVSIIGLMLIIAAGSEKRLLSQRRA